MIKAKLNSSFPDDQFCAIQNHIEWAEMIQEGELFCTWEGDDRKKSERNKSGFSYYSQKALIKNNLELIGKVIDSLSFTYENIVILQW